MPLGFSRTQQVSSSFIGSGVMSPVPAPPCTATAACVSSRGGGTSGRAQVTPAPFLLTLHTHQVTYLYRRSFFFAPVRLGRRASARRAMTITKERFLLVRCTPLGEQKLPAAAQVVQASIRDSVQENFGDFGVGCILTLLQVRHYSSDTGLLLLRVAREHAAMLRAALTLVCFVSNQPVRLTAISAAGVLHPHFASAAACKPEPERVSQRTGSARCGRRALVRQLQDLETAQEYGAFRTAVQHHLKAVRNTRTC